MRIYISLLFGWGNAVLVLLGFVLRPHGSSSGLSMCTLVPVKQVKLVDLAADADYAVPLEAPVFELFARVLLLPVRRRRRVNAVLCHVAVPATSTAYVSVRQRTSAYVSIRQHARQSDCGAV